MSITSKLAVPALAVIVATSGCESDDDTTPGSVTTTTESVTTTTEPATTATTAPTSTTTTLQYKPTDLFMALSAAGLEVTDRRDNTSGQCNDLPCSTWISSDILTVVVWDAPEDAEKWAAASALDVVIVGDRMTVRFSEGGSTPEYDRDAFNKVIESSD